MAAVLLSAIDLGSTFLRSENFNEYRWIFAVDIIFAFFAAYGIGANDVANAFGTSVGSKCLTMRQAVIIASVCEFCGAFFLGAEVTKTISGGIAKGWKFNRDPELLMFGMMVVDLAVAIWLWIATYMELPVSTTHSCVGGVMGMALVLKGSEGVYWLTKTPGVFPYIGGVTVIVISWITSPVLSFLAAGLLFFLVRLTCLRSAHAFDRSFLVMPVIVLIAVSINLMFLMKKGAKNHGSDDLSTATQQIASWGSGLFCALVLLAMTPWLKKRILRHKAEAADAAVQAETKAAVDAAAKAKGEGSDTTEDVGPPKVPFLMNPTWANFKRHTIDRDVHIEVSTIEKVNVIHSNAEVFDEDAESTFKYLQVFTACCNSLAHGANDVANAIGPLAAVAQIYHTSSFTSSSKVEKWILAVGGGGIVVGLATYGYNIIRAIGLKLSRITASRGFCIELGAATVVLVASNYGLPISTTHCLVGATVGVGALEGVGGVNWLLFAKMFAGWVFTLVAAGGLTAALVAIGCYSPSAQMAEQLRHIEDGMRARSLVMNYAFLWEAQAFNASADSVTPPQMTEKGYLTRVVPDVPFSDILSDKFYQEWKAPLYEDYVQFAKTTSWNKVWQQALGYAPPGYSGFNVSTVHPDRLFQMFDRVIDVGFSSNQAVVMKSIFSGEKKLCCDAFYKCCPRKCKYSKVDDKCKSKCTMKLKDPTCVEKACSELSSGSTGSFKTCQIIGNDDKCPFEMPIDDKGNYVGPKYVSEPNVNQTSIVDPTIKMPDFKDWREPNYDLTLKLCPVKIT